MSSPDEDRTVDEIYDALEAGVFEDALARARAALREAGEDPVLRFLAGVALLESDKAAQAVEEFRRATELDPDDVEFRANLALALYRSCRFEDARREARRAVEVDPGQADASYVLGLALERERRFDEADRCFERASAQDPDRFPKPVRTTAEAFAATVQDAGEQLPDEFRKHLAEVAVTVEDLPSEEILAEGVPPDPELLGLFVGTALVDRSSFSTGGDLPPRILLFKRNLERYATSDRELREEIARTLYHELAHYLGFDEDDMEPLDLH